jgi:hypothetical protein
MKHSAPQTIKIKNKKTTLKYTKEITITHMKTMSEISLAYKLQRHRRQQIQTSEQRHHMTKQKTKEKTSYDQYPSDKCNIFVIF